MVSVSTEFWACVMNTWRICGWMGTVESYLVSTGKPQAATKSGLSNPKCLDHIRVWYMPCQLLSPGKETIYQSHTICQALCLTSFNSSDSPEGKEVLWMNPISQVRKLRQAEGIAHIRVRVRL